MKPTVARNVHYQAYGTPGGEYKSVPRAAIITDVEVLPDRAGAVQSNPVEYADERNYKVGVCVLNPGGIFFNPDIKFDPDGKPGTWRWPPRE